MIERRNVDVEEAAPAETGTNGHGPKALQEAKQPKALPPGPPPAPPRRRSYGLLWLLVLAALGYAGWRYYTASEQKKAAAEAAQAARIAHRSVLVTAAQATRGDLPIYLRGLGTVTPYNTVNVKTRADGPIVSVNFQEGQHVQKGDLLVQIDPRPFQVAVDQAEGALARDQAQMKDAQTNLARYQALWNAGVIAKQQLDTQAAQVGQYQGSIESDKAAIANAQLNLSFTKVTAPISGRIGLRQVDVGNIVHAGDQNPIAVITQMQPIAVLFTIPADELNRVLPKLRAGARLPVAAFDRADVNQIAEGVLETVDNQIDPSTGTARLKAIFQNRNETLFPNQFVNCRLLLETRHGVVLVPAPAIQRGPQGPYVYVVTPQGTAAMRPVTVGITEGNQVEVTSGVAPGDNVITDGQDKLQDGAKIEVRGAPRAPAAGAPRGNARGTNHP